MRALVAIAVDSNPVHFFTAMTVCLRNHRDSQIGLMCAVGSPD
jgi:hypothetical protein